MLLQAEKPKTTKKKETTVKAEPAPSIFSKPGQKHITPPKVSYTYYSMHKLRRVTEREGSMKASMKPTQRVLSQ